MRYRRPTQVDVARLANVSQAMVSYALNDHEMVTVAPETRQRILDAAAALGYVPNTAARSLRMDKTFTIATIIPDITNPFYPTFQRGIQDIAEQQGYDLILYNSDGNAEKERSALISVQKRRVDGLIGVFFHSNAKALLPLLNMGTFIVRLEAEPKLAGDAPLDNLFVDNRAAALAAVNFLIAKGHRRIGMLAGSSGPATARANGYRQALTDNGIEFDPTLVSVYDFSETGGYHAMQQLLNAAIRPDAVFAENDMMAMGALMAIKDAGLRIPTDIALVGFDDIPIGRLVTPALTTVTQFQSRLGRRAAEMLLERINGLATNEGRSIEMPFDIVVRESA